MWDQIVPAVPKIARQDIYYRNEYVTSIIKDVRVMRPVVMPGTYGGGHVRPLRYATEARAYLCPACARRVMGVLRVG